MLNFSEITAVNLSCEQERMCKNSSEIAVLVKYNPLMRLDKHSIMLSITEIIMKVNNQCLSCILVEEVESVMKFMSETTAQWRNLSVEVRSERSMLEEVIANWDRYSSTELEEKSLNKEIVELTKALSVTRNDKIDWISHLKMEVSQLCDRRNDEIDR